MFPLSLQEIQIVVASVLFTLGCLCFVLGTFVLVGRGFSKDIQALAVHAARIGQKGVAQEITGLVSSASELVASITQLVRTASGIGVFLVLLGLGMIMTSYWVVLQIDWYIL